MSGIHFLHISYLSQVLPIFASILVQPVSIWTIKILARLFLKPNPNDIAASTSSQDNNGSSSMNNVDNQQSEPIDSPVVSIPTHYGK
ncbi:hypothetical protein BDP27DRAFT_1424590 [Rhodocollybia butyracea]|uniref:Uncharacterized protein n=1 Tax=Rhodocollybia butyracea TaxID=206335 RepID=A0A9P5PHE2_9AGAR|nr:hypothetical protein BDP27DRAFT_1424590 [Rhodocollybia butyracea]